MKPKFPFPYSEWQDHFVYFAKASCDPVNRAKGAIQLSCDHFSQKYKNQEESEWKRKRFVKAMSWREAHEKDLDYGKASVVGTTTRLTTNAVIVSLHLLFAEIPDSALDLEPTVEEVKQVVDDMIKKLTKRSS